MTTTPEYAALRDECVTVAGILCLMDKGEPLEPFLAQALGRIFVRLGAAHRMLGAISQHQASEFDAAAPRAALLAALVNEQVTSRGRKKTAAAQGVPTVELAERDATIARLRAQHKHAVARANQLEGLVEAVRRAAPHLDPMSKALRLLAEQWRACGAAQTTSAESFEVEYERVLPPLPTERSRDERETAERRRHQHETATRRRQARAAAPTEPTTGLHATAARILTALATFHPGTMTRVQVARVADMAPSGGAFSAHWTTLKQQGLIEERTGRWSATRQGLAALGADLPRLPKSFAARVDFWCERLKDAEARMLRFLANESVHMPVSRTELAREMGMAPSGGAFSGYVGTLTANLLVERTAHGLSIHPWLKEGPRA